MNRSTNAMMDDGDEETDDTDDLVTCHRVSLTELNRPNHLPPHLLKPLEHNREDTTSGCKKKRKFQKSSVVMKGKKYQAVSIISYYNTYCFRHEQLNQCNDG